MPALIEDLALIGNGHTAALVSRDGTIVWLCAPRFDSEACFASLLGGEDQGFWRIAPAQATRKVSRRFRDGSLILETECETNEGTVRLIDAMPLSDDRCDVVRIVEGVRGRVRMRMDLVIRFDYGSIIPWVRKVGGGRVLATAGPDTLELCTAIETHGEGMTTVAEFDVAAGERIPLVLRYRVSHTEPGPVLDAEAAIESTERRWLDWSRRCRYEGLWQEEVRRALVTLKALIYAPTGGIVAAPTTSLPEQLGGVRNWDYRYCWVRDATFAFNALLLAGYTNEAVAWREWLVRAIAGRPEDLQVLYSVTGRRRADEIELPWLAGYGGAAPVRVGNAAVHQFQLDIYGEVMDALHLSRAAGLSLEPHVWQIQLALLKFLSAHWREPDEGIWEVRGPRRHFTHSKVMAWVAFDRAVKDVEHFGLKGPVDEWRRTRDAIHAQVCESALDPRRKCFVQHYDTTDLDASLLLIPLVGFLPAQDARVRATIEAIQAELMVDGLLVRYAIGSHVDHLPAGEGCFLPCSFWLVDCLAALGQRDEAIALFERLLAMGNDVGLYAEESEPRTGRMLGNFPQALTHMALVNTARVLSLPQHEIARASAKGERTAAVAQVP